MTTVRWSEGEQCLILENGKRSHLDSHRNFCLRHEDAGPVLWCDIRVALLDASRSGREVTFAVKEDHSVVLPIGYLTQLYCIHNGAVQAEVVIPHASDYPLEQIADILEPFTAHIEHSIEPDENGFAIHVRPPDNWHVWQITAFVGLVQRLFLDAPADFSTTPAVAYLCVMTGNAHLLKGRVENKWLDTKRKYTDTNALAVDVASFANADGGLIVVGLDTKKDQLNRDVITDLIGCSPDDPMLRGYSDIIKDKIYPRVHDVEIDFPECRERPGKVFPTILVPAQSSDSKPFISRYTGVKCGGQAMIIPYRTGDSNSSIRIETAHSFLVGRDLFGGITDDSTNT